MDDNSLGTFGARNDNAVAWVGFGYPSVDILGPPMLAGLNQLAQQL